MPANSKFDMKTTAKEGKKQYLK